MGYLLAIMLSTGAFVVLVKLMIDAMSSMNRKLFSYHNDDVMMT